MALPQSALARFRTSNCLVVVSLLVLASLTFSVGPSHAAAASCTAKSPISKSYIKKWAKAHHASRYQIVVKDLTSGCKYAAGKQSTTYPTASTMKLMVAVRILEQVTKDELSLSSVKGDLEKMIRVSDDAAAQRLFEKVGSGKAITSIAKRFKLKKTRSSYSKGTTQTTAADQAKFFEAVIVNRPKSLGEPEHEFLLSLLDSVVASQRWGFGSGLPDGWSARGKNGWYHTKLTDAPPVNRSRVNTIGVIYDNKDQPRWVVAAFSDNWATTPQGIAAWKALNKRIASKFAGS